MPRHYQHRRARRCLEPREIRPVRPRAIARPCRERGRGSSPGASGSSSLSYFDNDEAMRTLRVFGTCYAARHPEDSLAFMATEPASQAEADLYRRMFRRDNQNCLGENTEIRMPVAFVRGAIVEGLYRNGTALPPDLALAPPPPRHADPHAQRSRALLHGGPPRPRPHADRADPAGQPGGARRAQGNGARFLPLRPRNRPGPPVRTRRRSAIVLPRRSIACPLRRPRRPARNRMPKVCAPAVSVLLGMAALIATGIVSIPARAQLPSGVSGSSSLFVVESDEEYFRTLSAFGACFAARKTSTASPGKRRQCRKENDRDGKRAGGRTPCHSLLGRCLRVRTGPLRSANRSGDRLYSAKPWRREFATGGEPIGIGRRSGGQCGAGNARPAMPRSQSRRQFYGLPVYHGGSDRRAALSRERHGIWGAARIRADPGKCPANPSRCLGDP